MNRSYSTTELARMWGVSESSIKRWADAGTIKCQKTVGGHRKFDLDDVLEFQSRSGLIKKDPEFSKATAQFDTELDELLAALDFTELSYRYLKASLEGRQLSASILLKETCKLGVSLATICEEIICPALHDIGEKWRTGNLCVFEEHVATSVTLQAISELNSIAATHDNAERIAVVGCSESELHQIASVMVKCILESEGWSVVYLGPHTPLFSYTDAINEMKPALVCISTTMIDHIERAARDYEALRRAASKHGTKVVIGGRAIEDDFARSRFQGARYATTLYELMEILEAMSET